jgi:hypothetical protein
MIKKTFLFLFVVFITSSVFAQFGVLTISSNTNQKFWLFIDDVLQNEYSTHSIKIQDLQFIPYKVRVEMDNPVNNSIGQTVMISNMPNQNNYMVSADRMNNFIFGQAKTAVNPFFVQNVILPDYSYLSAYQQFLYPGFNPNANYGQNQHKGSAYKRYQNNPQGSAYGQGGGQSYNNPGQGNQMQGNQMQNNQGHGNHGHGATPLQVRCMSNADFNKALSVIRNESFENSKLSTAKQVASNNNLCVEQIIQICKLFDFEKSKLDFAKFAYKSCVDQNNYYQLNEVFEFNASKNELRKFIDGN